MNPTVLKLIIAVVAGLFLLAAFTLVSDSEGRTALVGLAAVLVGWIVPSPGGSGTKSPLALAFVALALLGGAPACSPGFSWPKVVTSCAPAPSALIDEVAEVLKDGPGSLSDRALKALEDLGRKHGGATILCIVNELVDELTGKVGASPDEARAAAHGREFLRRVGSKVEQ